VYVVKMSKEKMVIPDKCPHCRRGISWQYLCSLCGRGWIVLDNKYWLACFDAGGHVYEVIKDGEIIDHNSFKDEKLRKRLWDRVRGK